jgi:Rps23 Pro-64 3,4-dihydroxylase Tpa1-like proline 4-hydroxylase
VPRPHRGIGRFCHFWIDYAGIAPDVRQRAKNKGNLTLTTTTTKPPAKDWQQPLQLAQGLITRLSAEASRLKSEFGVETPQRIRYCVVDDVLPPSVMEAAYSQLPKLGEMVRRADMRERKYVSANIGKLDAHISDIVRAFSHQKVADAVAQIIGVESLEADPTLYNGGITVMLPGDFMCPHLDNSHDQARKRRRAVVLLYYFSPSWQPDYEGTLELWQPGEKTPMSRVPFKSNRLVILETTERSWHAITPILGPQPRVSVTTYYYEPPNPEARVRLTRFTSWPDAPLRGKLFDAQFCLRSIAARVIGRSIGNRHVYRPTADSKSVASQPAR